MSPPWKPGKGSVKVIENVTIRYRAYDFLLMFYCNYMILSRVVSEIFYSNFFSALGVSAIMRYINRRFTYLLTYLLFNVEKYRDLEIPVNGQSRSSKVVSFDRLSMVSYWCSIVTLSLCPYDAQFLIYLTSKMPWPWKPGYGSVKVIENITIR